MKLNPKEILRPAVSLLVICLAVTVLLAGTNLLTKDQIANQSLLAEQSARAAVCPEGKTFEPGDEEGSYYVAKDGDSVVGYIFTTEASGYGGKLKVMTGISSEGTVTGISFLSIDETPGLGMNAQKDAFKDQYKQTVPENGFTLIKSGEASEGEINAMTGATITSNAVTEAVNAAITQYNKIKEGA